MNNKALTFAGLALAGLVVAASPAFAHGKRVPVERSQMRELKAPEPGTLEVSSYEYNYFVFPSAVTKILTPSDSGLQGKPVYVDENRGVLLEVSALPDKRPTQVVFVLGNGKVESLRLSPEKIPGVTIPVDGARLVSGHHPERTLNKTLDESGQGAAAHTENAKDIELLKELVTGGQPPDGFDPVSLPAVARFDKFSVVPLAGWSDGTRRVFVLSLVAAEGQTAVVSPPQFYRPGISAVMLSGDTVDATHSPQLYVVEELNDE